MSHYPFNDGTKYGGIARTMVNLNESGDYEAEKFFATLVQMRTGDGSQDSHYDAIRDAMGFVTSAAARGWFEEFDAANAKTSGDGSVSGVKSARRQFYARSR